MATKKPAAKAAAKAAPKAAPKAAAKKGCACKNVPTTKAGILDAIAEAAGITKVQAKDAYDKLLCIAYAGAKAEGGILLPGLGKFVVAKRAARTGINPLTKQKIKIKACNVLKFRICKAAKDAVVGKK